MASPQYRDPHNEFAYAIKAAGLVLDDLPVMDGKWHRLATVDSKRGSKDGSYIGYLDGRPSGHIQNFKTGLKESWTATAIERGPQERTVTAEPAVTPVTAAEAQAARQQRAVELASQYEQAANNASLKWERLADVAPAAENPYLNRKNVPAYGVKFDGDRLVIPVRDVDGKLWSLQSIAPEEGAAKLFEKGGRKAGNMHVIGELKPGADVLVAEGYATGASIHQATGKTVVVAFDAGNIDPVVAAIKGRYPTNPVYIMGDDDRQREPNVGFEKALAAAHKHQVGVAFPQFKEASKLSDFNDLHASEGLAVVKAQVNKATSQFMEETRDQAAARTLPTREKSVVPDVPTAVVETAVTPSQSPSRSAVTPDSTAPNNSDTSQRALNAAAAPQDKSLDTVERGLSPASVVNSIERIAPQQAVVNTIERVAGRETERETTQRLRSDPPLEERFNVVPRFGRGRDYHFRDQPGKVAFTERWRSMQSNSDAPPVVKAMLDRAQERGWDAIRVKGSEEFQRQVWIAATARNIKAVGYEPTDGDRALAMAEADRLGRQRVAPMQQQGGTLSLAKPSAHKHEQDQKVVDGNLLRAQPVLDRAATSALATLEGLAEKNIAAAHIHDRAAPGPYTVTEWRGQREGARQASFDSLLAAAKAFSMKEGPWDRHIYDANGKELVPNVGTDRDGYGGHHEYANPAVAAAIVQAERDLRRLRSAVPDAAVKSELELYRLYPKAAEPAVGDLIPKAHRHADNVDARSIGVKEPSPQTLALEKPIAEPLRKFLSEQGIASKEVEATVALASERITGARVHVGQVVARGDDHFEFDKKNGQSYHVTLKTAAGEEVVWGKDLSRALVAGDVKVGDNVALEHRGKTPVTVWVKDRDPAGNVIGGHEVEAVRNDWQAIKVDQLRLDAIKVVAPGQTRQEPSSERAADVPAKAKAPRHEAQVFQALEKAFDVKKVPQELRPAARAVARKELDVRLAVGKPVKVAIYDPNAPSREAQRTVQVPQQPHREHQRTR